MICGQSAIFSTSTSTFFFIARLRIHFILTMVTFGFLLFISILSIVSALKCYKTDSTTGEDVVVDDPTFVYCISFPFAQMLEKMTLKDNKTPKLHKIVADGISVEELDADFGQFFDENPPAYDVLSVCLFEKYDWPKMWRASPKFTSISPSIEYQFRCLCNTDFCNAPSKFDEYLSNLTDMDKLKDRHFVKRA